jgi:hypothetical protein
MPDQTTMKQSVSTPPPEIPQKQPKMLQKTIDAMMLVDAGLSFRKALQATNMKQNVSNAGIACFKAKYKKHSLTAPKTVKLAHDVITDILAGTPQLEPRKKITKDGQVVEYNEEVMPTWSNRATVALAVYDRYEPVKGADPGPGQGNTYIDLSQYKIDVNVDKPVDNSGSQPIYEISTQKDE